MYTVTYISDSSARPCPFCNSVVILVSDVQFEKAEDEGYKIMCDCGWAGRALRKWSSNKMKLIEEWNSFIQDGEYSEIKNKK